MDHQICGNDLLHAEKGGIGGCVFADIPLASGRPWVVTNCEVT